MACKGNVRFYTFPIDASASPIDDLHLFVYNKIENELDGGKLDDVYTFET